MGYPGIPHIPGYPQNGGTPDYPIPLMHMLDLTIIHVYLGYMPIPGVPQMGSIWGPNTPIWDPYLDPILDQ